MAGSMVEIGPFTDRIALCCSWDWQATLPRRGRMTIAQHFSAGLVTGPPGLESRRDDFAPFVAVPGDTAPEGQDENSPAL
jgi:hypothetical protein